VRLIGVDTPETKHPKKPVERFGKEASEFTRRMVEGKRVRLELDPANAAIGHKDNTPQRRTLAYVFLEDGTLLNAEIIKQGYGFALSRYPFARMEEFRRLGVKRGARARPLGSVIGAGQPTTNRSKRAGMRYKVIALLVVGFALASLHLAEAQQAKKVPRIGVLFIGSQNQPHLAAFKQGLREHGYTEGKDIVLEYRYAEGRYDRLPELASDLARMKVDVIVTTSAISAHAARKATNTIPIVMTTGNPEGLVASLAKPGGNVTGLTVMAAELSGKRIEILKETFPNMGRVAVLWARDQREAVVGFKETQEAVQAFSLKLQSVELQRAEDIENAFAEIPKARPNALCVILSPLVTLHSKRIVELALNHNLPGMYPTRQFVEEGGLMAYGPLIADLYRRAAHYVDKILKGAKAADLPFEQPTKFEFIVNLKTAKQIGLTIPPHVLARADRVIK
jgi:putative tryptophan/tyrosine transport system substrate-binding protein